MTTEDLQISWLHCNICHRAFEGHNQVKQSGESLVLVHSDLYFYFTGCGHFFCENCLKEEFKGSSGNNKQQCRCRICGEQTQAFKIFSTISDKVSMYLKPPINLLEDSLSIMMFQLNNANKLIAALRAKISSQKDLLTRAKQEISQVKDLKQRIKILEEKDCPFNPANPIPIDPNESLRIANEFHRQQHETIVKIPQQPIRNNHHRSHNVPFSPFMNPVQSHTRGYTGAIPYSSAMPPPDSPLIHVSGRLSLKSPSLTNTPNLNNTTFLNSTYPQQMSINRSKVPRRVIKRP